MIPRSTPSPLRPRQVAPPQPPPEAPGLREALTGDDPARRLGALERLICAQLSLDEGDVDGLARAYRALSEALVAREGGASGRLQVDDRGVGERERLGVWGLIYGARSFEIARGLGLDWGARVAELGAGWGPFGLAAGLSGAQVQLVDLAGPNLRLGEGLCRRLDIPCQTHRQDALRWQGEVDTLVLAYSMNELFGRSQQLDRAARQLARWLEMAGQVVIVDPGDARSAGFLMALRDRLQAQGFSVQAPCLAAGPCPLGGQDKQWCHFTWRLPLGPLGRRVADRAGRKWQGVHFSWITVSKAPLAPAPQLGRLLERRPLGRPKLQLRLCTEDGLIQLTVQRKRKPAFAHAEALRPGQLLRWSTDMELRGDGYRLDQPEQLSLP